MDSSPPGSSIHSIQQARILEWAAISLEGMMLRLKLQYFGHLMRRVDSKLIQCFRFKKKKDSDAGRDWGQEEKGTTEDEMARWHH